MLGSLWMVGGLVELGVTVLVVMMSFVGEPWDGRGCDRLLEGGWFVVLLMVGKYISMVVCDRKRLYLLVRAGWASVSVGVGS